MLAVNISAHHINTSKLDIFTKLGISRSHHMLISWLPHREVEGMDGGAVITTSEAAKR